MGWRKWIVRPASNDSGEGAGVNTRGRVFFPSHSERLFFTRMLDTFGTVWKVESTAGRGLPWRLILRKPLLMESPWHLFGPDSLSASFYRPAGVIPRDTTGVKIP